MNASSEKTAADFRVTAKERGTAKEIFKHVGRLKYQDEDWKTRDEVLERLQTDATVGLGRGAQCYACHNAVASISHME